VRGRDFNWQDNGQTPRVAILSGRLAEQLFPGGEAIGQHINIGTNPKRRNVEVIGVVNDARVYESRSSIGSTAFVDVLQEGKMANWPLLEIRSAGEPAAVAAAVRQTVESLGREYILKIGTLAQACELSLLQDRITAMLSEFFCALALLLVATGLYGLMAYSVTRRTREMGIRMALGAKHHDILRMVMRETLRLVGVGVAVGVPLASLTARLTSNLMSGLLFGLQATDPFSVAVATGMMTAVALLAGYLPARRATKVDPMVALRYE